MFVRDYMSTPAVTIRPDTPFQTALNVMRQHHFRRLPVVDKNGHLAGIVSERDLLYAAPSPATSLSVWEMNYLLTRLRVQQIMTRAIIIATPDTPIEHAANLMVDNKIGGLPVVDENNEVVGVITQTDIFKVFVSMLDDGYNGVRLTLALPAETSLPIQLFERVTELGGQIMGMGRYGCQNGRSCMLIKIRGVLAEQLQDILQGLNGHVLDVHELSTRGPDLIERAA